MKEVLCRAGSVDDNKKLINSNSFVQSRRVRTKSVFDFVVICAPFASHEHTDTMLADELNDH